jgi:hypothetical protein
LVGSSLTQMFETKAQLNGSGKHSSLLRYGNNYCCKMFYSTGPWMKASAFFSL